MEIEKVEIKSEIPEHYLLSEDGSETESPELINQKPYKCGICGHRTTADTLLKVHMKMHFMKRLHRCHVCKESFSFVTELNTHILTHSREVSGFRCEHCGKDCFTDEDLHRHYRIHTKEKPYRCKLCLRCFSEEFYLRAHERSHHGEEYAKRNMMQDGTFVDPSLVQHLSDDSIKVSVREEKEKKIFKNSHPLVPLSNEEKLLLLKFVQEMNLNTKYSEMEQIKSYLKNSWVKMSQLFADNHYDRNPEKLARTYFHLKNHAKSHLERYYKHKKLPKPHQIDYMFIKLYPAEFDIPGLNMQELLRDAKLLCSEDIKEENEIDELNPQFAPYEEITIKEEPLEESHLTTISNDCPSGPQKRSNSDNNTERMQTKGPKAGDSLLKVEYRLNNHPLLVEENERDLYQIQYPSGSQKRSNSDNTEHMQTKCPKAGESLLKVEYRLNNHPLLVEENKRDLYQIQLKYKNDLHDIEQKYKDELYKKDIEIMLLKQKFENSFGDCRNNIIFKI